jgi:hypothetical protein
MIWLIRFVNRHKTPNPSPVSHPKDTVDRDKYKAHRRESKHAAYLTIYFICLKGIGIEG